MGLFSGIAGAVGGITSTILGNNSAKHEAERNRDWQEEMSNTSIQRRMADLKAAGLNPLLAVSSAQAGASTPTGGQANIQSFDPATISTMMNGLASAKLTQAQAKAQEQENSIFETKAKALELQNDLMKKNIINADVERELKMAQTDSERAKILTEAYKRANYKADTDKINNEAMLLGFQNKPYIDNPDFATSEKLANTYSNPVRMAVGLAELIGKGLVSSAKGVYNLFGGNGKK